MYSFYDNPIKNLKPDQWSMKICEGHMTQTDRQIYTNNKSRYLTVSPAMYKN